MARLVHRLLPLLLAACLLLLEASGCSSSASSPTEDPTKPSGDTAVHSDALHHHHLLDAEARTARLSEMAAGGGRTSTADDDGEAPSAAATPARAEGVVGVAWRPKQKTVSGRALVGAGLRPAVLLPSKLARRLLAVAGVDEKAVTDGARPSCSSSDVHTRCPPPSSKP